MTRWLRAAAVGCVLGCGFSGTLGAEERGRAAADLLREVSVDTEVGAPLVVPPEYGRLATVAISGDIHYLYFQDEAGGIRVLVIGPQGSSATQRSRQDFQLLTPSVYLMKRGHAAEAASP